MKLAPIILIFGNDKNIFLSYIFYSGGDEPAPTKKNKNIFAGLLSVKDCRKKIINLFIKIFYLPLKDYKCNF